MATDELREVARWHYVVDRWLTELAELKPLGVEFRKTSTSHSGQPIPRLILALTWADSVIRDELIDSLWKQNPGIAVLPEEGGCVALNPHMIKDDEISSVSRALLSAIRALIQN